jgi:hypothetical protein
MATDCILSQPRDYSTISTIDRLTLSRTQHFQSRENRPKSVSDDEIDAVSEWSDSDQECCPLSDFESNIDGNGNYHDIPFDENKLLPEISHSNVLRITETPLPIINDSTTSTRIVFTNENDKFKQKIYRKPSQAPLLPARRIQTKGKVPNRSSNNFQLSYTRYRKTITASPTRFNVRREITSTTNISNTHLTKDSSNSSFHSHDDNQSLRPIISPTCSQTSVPRIYEMKKSFVDDYDYGRLTDLSSTRLSRPISRQKWGTIVHPPFPLGYQHIAPEQVTQAVERLSSSLRCRDRHTPIQTPSKRYLSVEETDALVQNELFFYFDFVFVYF